jgi:ATP-dependent Lhr-like helicase
MKSSNDVLSLFHPLIGRWFERRYGTPTPIQQMAWPVIASGGHVLMTAPTGSGKTLSAFLWGLNQLITGEWGKGGTSILYVSPLRALNNDIRVNLLDPLSELRDLFLGRGEAFPDIKVQTRSGDTEASTRQRMLRHPPQILITTPESLNLLLSSMGGRGILGGIVTVILDEIHAVAADKRGTHLISAVERLVLLSGEFQRIALSATVRPLDRIAEFVGGYELAGPEGERRYRKRRVSIVRAPQIKEYEVEVSSPGIGGGGADADAWWTGLIDELKARIALNRSTLIFANSRRFTEKLARLINESGEGDERLVYSHHGSLSREIRHLVEKKLKAGELRGIVATSSLELGIDIGELDEVILVQAPYSVSSALQRIGRAGHGVHQKSRALLYPLFSRDYLDCAVIANAVVSGDIEQIHIPSCPLDVLAQIIISMTALSPWTADELFGFIRTASPYQTLGRGQFELVLQMLAGKYADTRIRELKPRLSIDPLTGHIRCREGALRVLYMSGGTIPDRGYFHLKVHDSGAKIGELDEEFVWERSIGDVFAFGMQHWRIKNIDHQNVEVLPVGDRPSMAPFWKADFGGRDFHLSELIGLALQRIEQQNPVGNALQLLIREYHMDDASGLRLLEFLTEQRRSTGSGLPHRYRIMVEHLRGLDDGPDSRQLVFHLLWGGRVITPFCIALAQAWEERYGSGFRIYHDDDSVLISLPEGGGASARELLSLVTPENLERLLRSRLETTGIFGARFRENAGRALLLPKRGFNRRTPLWLSRIRSKELLQAVQGFEDFPILAETWRTCLRDEFDLEHLKGLLDEMERGLISVEEVTLSSPSPLASEILHWQTHTHMYEDDTPEYRTSSMLREDILREVAFSPELRPEIPSELLDNFIGRLKRTAEGYAPQSAEDLYDWIVERLLIPVDEMKTLMGAIRRDAGLEADEWLGQLAEVVAEVSLPGADTRALVALENLPKILTALFVPEEDEVGLGELLMQWLRYEGPVYEEYLVGLFGVERNRLGGVIDTLVEERSVLRDRFLDDREALIDGINLERLLRLMRRERRRPFSPLALDDLPLYLALHQGLIHDGQDESGGRIEEDIGALQEVMELLFGYSGRAESWERDYFPSRLPTYSQRLLDLLMQQNDLIWFGTGRERLSFCFEEDLELFRTTAHAAIGALDRIFPDKAGRYGLLDLQRHSNLAESELENRLWDLAWRGLVSNDRFSVVRRGVERGFSPAEPELKPRAARLRSGINRWKSTTPPTGNWYRIDGGEESGDLIDEEERNRDRARLLLDRYGVLFRELLRHELPGLRWGPLFRSLRIMELSGEVLAGYFFEGVPGLQFASLEAFERLQSPLPDDRVYWMNATDPASPCGMGLEGLELPLPRRINSNYLVFHGKRLVLVLKRGGAALQFMVPPGSRHIQQYLAIFRTLCAHSSSAPIRVERIDEKPALGSPYEEQLLRFGFTRRHRDLVLRRDYT